MSDDEEVRGPASPGSSGSDGQAADPGPSGSDGQAADPGPQRGPGGLPKRTAGGPGPARKRRPSRDTSDEPPREHSALDPTAPFGRRFQSLGDRIDDANRTGTTGAGPEESQGQDGAGPEGGNAAGVAPAPAPVPDVSLFDQPPRPPRQPAGGPTVTVRVKPAADSPRRSARRRVGPAVAGAVAGVLVIGGVLFAVLPKGDHQDGRGGNPVGLSSLPGPGPGSVSGQPRTGAGATPSGSASGRPGAGVTGGASAGPGGSAAKASATPDGTTPAGTPSDPVSVSGGQQAPPSATPPPAAPPKGTSGGVALVGHQSGRCVSIVNGSAAVSGERLEIRDCADVPWQRWTAAPDGTLRAEGKCMDLNGNVTDNGVTVGWVDCNGTSAQLWTLNSSHDLVNAHADKCLDVTDSATGNGARLQIWDCSGADNQKWSTR